MISFIRDMLRTPEAQQGAYEWGAVLLAHFGIGLFLTAALAVALGVWRAAAVVSVGYLLLWEGAQMAFYGADLSDSIVDAVAVACGTVVAAGAWRNRGLAVAGALALLAAIGIAGIRRRK